MGDPRKPRKKYSRPSHPWRKTRIEEEKVLQSDYGLSSMKEIWRMKSFLSNATQQAKNLSRLSGKQAEKEKEQLLNKLKKYGLITKTSTLTEVLGLSVKDVLERRLETLVHRKGFAKSMKQARQYIVHGHIKVGGHKMTIPSYMVMEGQEATIEFLPSSSLSDPNHPERAIPEKAEKKAENKPKKSEKPAEKEKGKKKEEKKEEAPKAAKESEKAAE